MKVNLLMEWDLEKAFINGQMVVIMMDSGRLTKWMDEAYTEVLMEQ